MFLDKDCVSIVISHVSNDFGVLRALGRHVTKTCFRSRDDVVGLFGLACGCGYLDVVKCLVDTFRLNASDARVWDNYALRWASGNGYLDVVKYLVDTFELNASDARANNNHALRWASCSGHLDVVKYLVDTFELNASDARANNDHALRWASGSGHLDVVKYLVDTLGLNAHQQIVTMKYLKTR